MIEFLDGSAPEQIETVRQLFTEYAAWLNVDLCFQGFEEELASLPGKYAPPKGRILIAKCDGKVSGVVALRPFSEIECEMKRLWVRPEFRGKGIGRALVDRILSEAQSASYEYMVLDTLERMQEARKMYSSFGFETCESYYPNPLDQVTFMRKMLY